jgi:hypothetical protein
MRCPECCKFVRYGDGYCDEEHEFDLRVNAVSDDHEVELLIGYSVTVVLPCFECDTPLKECRFEGENLVMHRCPEPLKSAPPERFELELPDGPVYEETGRSPVMRGFSASGQVVCRVCGLAEDVAISDEAPPFLFDEVA